ncbi:MAG: flagellar biosynthesis protein FlgF [Planctomycetaceae bacterium]|nr:flagellar biosynthesis protein FlgF [Planctomycetaceae bacterium]
MPYGMYISAAGAAAQSERLQILSNNLANVDTPGFKRELAIFQARHSEAIERGEAVAGLKGIEDVGGGVQLAESLTDYATGAVCKTGVATDMAIDGDGFFLVAKDGEQFLTRAGNFHFSANGELHTEQGHAVMSPDGEPVAIDPTLPWRALEDGSIQQEGNKTLLGVVKPQSLGDLVKAGENFFSPLASFENVPANERSIKSGYLELSGVKPAAEMMELIETSRAYEANIRLIQNQDHMLESLLSRVLRQ